MNSEQTDFSTAGLPGETGFFDEKRLLARLPVSRQRQKAPTRRNSETALTAERHIERRGEI
jgi:hypothetical protein